MGVVSTDGVSTFSSNVHASFSGSGTTDGGLAFGGSFDMHNASGADGGTSGSAYISGAFGKIAMGGVNSGDKAVVGNLASVGYEGLGSGNSISYAADGGALALADPNAENDVETSNDGAKVLYTYSNNGLTLAASSAQLTDGGATAYGVGVSYTTGGLTLALGTGQTDVTSADVGLEDPNHAGDFVEVDLEGSITDTSASVTYVMGDTTIMAIYQDKSATVTGEAGVIDVDTELTATSMGMSVSHKIDAVTLTAYSITTEIDAGDLTADKPTASRYGIGATYNLGGGATLAAGWAMVDTATFSQATEDLQHAGVLDDAATYTTETTNMFDVGVNFSF